MAKRIKSKRIKIKEGYGWIMTFLSIVMFGVIAFFTGKFFGKKEKYTNKQFISENYDFFEEDTRNKLAMLNKI